MTLRHFAILTIPFIAACSPADASHPTTTTFGVKVDPIVGAEAIACIDATHAAVLTLDQVTIYALGPGSLTPVASLSASADKVSYDWMAAAPGRLYVSDNASNSVRILDLSNMASPVELGTTTKLKRPPLAMGQILYAAEGNGIVAIDATDPTNLVMGTVVPIYQRIQKFTPSGGTPLGIVGQTLLVLNGEHTEITSLSLANPMAPAEVARTHLVDPARPGSDRLRMWGGALRGSSLFVGASRISDTTVKNGSLTLSPAVFDVSDPAKPRLTAAPEETPTPPTGEWGPAGSTTIVAGSEWGVIGVRNIGPGGAGSVGEMVVYFPNGSGAPTPSLVYVGTSSVTVKTGDQIAYRDGCFAGRTMVLMNDRAVFVDLPK